MPGTISTDPYVVWTVRIVRVDDDITDIHSSVGFAIFGNYGWGKLKLRHWPLQHSVSLALWNAGWEVMGSNPISLWGFFSSHWLLSRVGSALGPTKTCGPQSLASALILAGFFSALGPVERSGPHSLASAPRHRCIFEGIGLSSNYLTSTIGPMVPNPKPG